MSNRDAWLLYLRAILRAQDTRHITTWSADDLFAAYVIALIPQCTFEQFCREMQITIDMPTEQTEEQEPIEPEPGQEEPMSPDKVDAINDNAIKFFKLLGKNTSEVKVEEPKPEPVPAEATKPIQEV